MKISANRDLDVHWCRPDQYDYRALRSNAKHAKGTPKEARAAQVAEHERLSALWKEHCPASIDMDEAWEAIGLNSGALWMCGGVFFELDGVVYLNLGLRLEEGMRTSRAPPRSSAVNLKRRDSRCWDSVRRA